MILRYSLVKSNAEKAWRAHRLYPRRQGRGERAFASLPTASMPQLKDIDPLSAGQSSRVGSQTDQSTTPNRAPSRDQRSSPGRAVGAPFYLKWMRTGLRSKLRFSKELAGGKGHRPEVRPTDSNEFRGRPFQLRIRSVKICGQGGSEVEADDEGRSREGREASQPVLCRHLQPRKLLL